MPPKAFPLRTRLPLSGIDTLAPEFDEVEEGREFKPEGCIDPLWSKSQPACVTHWAILKFAAEHLVPSSIPAGSAIRHGDPNIFQLPPVRGSAHAAARSTACLILSSAKERGYYCRGRYRQLLLGHTKRGKPVKIYVHRLICWIVNGAITGEARKRRVTCHDVTGCPPTGACCNPLHLRCESTSTQTQLPSTNLALVRRTCPCFHIYPLSRRFATDAANRKDRCIKRALVCATAIRNQRRVAS